MAKINKIYILKQHISEIILKYIQIYKIEKTDFTKKKIELMKVTPATINQGYDFYG